MLVNCWDVGSAVAVARSGAAAVATSSWAVAAAAGAEDGEQLDLASVLDLARRLVAAVEVPVSIDLERGYADDVADLPDVVRAVVETGVAGINIEDGTVDGVRERAEQAERFAAVSRAAQSRLFVNARTDVFLTSDHGEHAGLVSDAVERARAYADAGADGFFVPGLLDAGLVADVVAGSPLPVNVMVSTREQARALAQAGAARISLGPAAYLAAMEAVTADAGAWLAA
ncbi:isocitrate lyase/PEP mutase family protein [Pseudactinotalea suaedae]|uniref:isocitrate lyase/PEP mutase family protein n=1 Tax=Pseudactinotalea suaedae TaxID=1524924 RepID=UPI0019D511F9